MMHYLKRELWGYSLWRDGKQYGAGVGLSPFLLHTAPQVIKAVRLWRKHGLLILSGQEGSR